MKYLVMECHLSHAVVLSEDGRFLKTANLHYEPGQTVTDIVEMQAPLTKPAKKRGWIAPLAAMAACLALVVVSLFQMGRTPYASVYLSINPEVRIDVDRRDMVVGLAGMNGDGDALIEGYGYRDKGLETVMDELVDRAIQMGYLHEGGQITLTLDAEDDQWIVERGHSLGVHLQEHLTQTMSVTIEIGGVEEGSHEVIVPVTPGAATPEDSYGEDDYGETPAPGPTPTPTPDPVPTPTPGPPAQTQPPAASGPPSRDDGQTDYGAVPDDGGQSDYERPDPDDGQSDYETPASDDGQSDYETPAPDDGQSDYETPAPDDGQSDDETPASDDDQSGDETPVPDDGQSDYETPVPDDDQSDDETPVSDDGQSDYETPVPDDDQSDDETPVPDDDGQSDYETEEDDE